MRLGEGGLARAASGGAGVRVNARAVAFFAFVAAVALGSSVASAQALHLKLSSEAPRVAAAQPVKVKVMAVATRSLSLPAAPVFLVDGGAGSKPETVAAAGQHEGRVEVTPDKSQTGDYELMLSKPGTYKIQAEYRVDDRPVRSNKVTVQVMP